MRIGAILLTAFLAQMAMAQTTQPSEPAQPTTRPLPADQLLNQMLKPSNSAARPIQPEPSVPPVDSSTGTAAVAPGAQQINVIREGTFLVDRTGRLTKSADGQNWEFTFEADSRAMQDPPVIILPNLKLMAMEQAVQSSNRDVRFRVTGMVTEYNGRNYLLMEKVVVIPDLTQQF
jgi:hypothetical protein